MHVAAKLFGCFFLAGVLLDAFQTIILPRRPVGRLRITRVFFLLTWQPWVLLVRRVRHNKVREQLLSIYGPASLLLLFALWAFLLVLAYALIYLGMHMPFTDPMHPATELERLRSCIYVSGSTIFTLGLGDVLPATRAARTMLVVEAGTGLGFVALVIGYVPVLYTAFSTREIQVALLDARAGSPPTAGELLLRHNFNGGHQALTALLAEWERWCAQMLETHISYPILCYYRSQHDNQSWLSSLTAVLDACALLITTVENPSTRQAQLTFAIGRHTLVDLVHVFRLEEQELRLEATPPERVPDADHARLCEQLLEAGYALCGDVGSRQRLAGIRALYEPHAWALANYLQMTLPQWAPPEPDPARRADQWTKVANLRSPAAESDRLTLHVSRQAAAAQLQDEWRSRDRD
jgi:hypothetical protein